MCLVAAPWAPWAGRGGTYQFSCPFKAAGERMPSHGVSKSLLLVLAKSVDEVRMDGFMPDVRSEACR